MIIAIVILEDMILIQMTMMMKRPRLRNDKKLKMKKIRMWIPWRWKHRWRWSLREDGTVSFKRRLRRSSTIRSMFYGKIFMMINQKRTLTDPKQKKAMMVVTVPNLDPILTLLWWKFYPQMSSNQKRKQLIEIGQHSSNKSSKLPKTLHSWS